MPSAVPSAAARPCGVPRRGLLVKIIGGVSAAILVIELILLVPSLISRRHQLREVRVMTAMVLAKGLHQAVAETLAAGDRGRALRIVDGAARNDYVYMVTLVDAHRIVIACSIESHIGQVRATPTIEAALTAGGPPGSSAEVGGKYLYALPIRGAGGAPIGALEVSVDFSDIPRELLAFSLRTLGVVLIILVFTGAAIGLYLYAIVIKPVWRIVRANRAAAGGDRANAYVPAHEIPDDEIGDIARTRNELLAVIEQHSQDLEAVILRGISDPIALLDADRRVLLRNRPAVPLGDGCGCEVHRLLPAMPVDACPVARALETGVPVSLAFAVEGPEGTRYLEAFTFPLAEGGPAAGGAGVGSGGPADESPRARKVIEHVRDITERYRLEEAARRCERLAVVGELAAGMAHEIRNPLASIVASVDLLDLEAGRPVGHEGQVLLGVLKKEAKRINQLLTDFLKFARPRPLRLCRTDVNAILRGVGELARTHPKNGGRVLVREALDTSLPVIEADADLIEQALLNIAINALEAMPQGGELSLLTTAAAPASDDGVEIAIADTGTGISEQERQRIFEPFHTTKPDGTGLGLAITYRVVEQHGGSIAVDGRPGAGTTVRIRLPRSVPAAAGTGPRRAGR